MAMHNPPHPRGILRRQCLELLDLSVTKAAKGPGVTRQALSSSGQWQGRGFGRYGRSPFEGL